MRDILEGTTQVSREDCPSQASPMEQVMEDLNGDRRQFPRYSKDITVDVNGRIFPVSERVEQMVEGKDISVSGLCFASPTPYDIGAKLTMTVRITEMESDERDNGLIVSKASNPIATVAEVVRVTPESDGSWEIGVKFLDITGEDCRVLIQHLARD